MSAILHRSGEFFGCLLLALLLGCSGAESSVTGTVTYNGQPLSTGTVTFIPANGGPNVVGQIDSSGRYALSTGATPGAPAGDYEITVVATEFIDDPTGVNAPTPKPLIPARYGRPETSKLTFTVKPGVNVCDLKLER